MLKGEKQTEKYKAFMREKMKGNKNALGFKHTDKSKQKIREKAIGRKYPFKERLKSKGRKVWNKGLTKETDKRVANYSKKSGISQKGKKLTKEHKEKIREIAIKKGFGKWMRGRTGVKCYQYKGGLPKCIDCDKLLSAYKSKRCNRSIRSCGNI